MQRSCTPDSYIWIFRWCERVYPEPRALPVRSLTEWPPCASHQSGTRDFRCGSFATDLLGVHFARCPQYPESRHSVPVQYLSRWAKSRHRTALASGRDCPCSVDNRRIIFVRPVHRQHQDELARWGWEPVRLLVGTGRSRYRAQARSLRSAQLLEHLPQRVQGNASARAVEALPWMLSKVF